MNVAEPSPRAIDVPEAWIPGLVRLCETSGHEHAGKPCPTPGKRPLDLGFNTSAANRWRHGDSSGAWRAVIEHHLAAGGNVGLVPPPGILVLDADSEAAVAWLDEALPAATPVQCRMLADRSGWVAGKAHYYVRMSRELAERVKAKQLRAEGPDGPLVIDLRTPGKAQAVVAPSRHVSGDDYAWDVPLPDDLADVPACPVELEEWLLSFHTRALVEPGAVADLPGHDRLRRYINRWCRFEDDRERVRERARTFAATRVYAGREGRLAECLAPGGELDKLVDTGWMRFGAQNPLAEEKSDTNVARLLLADQDGLLFDAVSRVWMLREDDGVWRQGSPEHATACVMALAGELWEDSMQEVVDTQRRDRLAALAASLRNMRGIRPVVDAARSLALCRTTDFDAQPDLLYVAGGLVLDTSSAEFHGAQDVAGFRPTRVLGTDFRTPSEAAQARWVSFVERTFPGEGLATFVQRAAGATLLGRDKPHAILFVYGQGGTGKSTFLQGLARMLGTYAEKFTFDLFTGERELDANQASPEIARLHGVRMAYCSEIGSRARLGARMKDLTGGEPLNARRLYGAPFQFQPTHTVWVAGNEAPSADFLDSGIERRLQIMPADAKVDAPDMRLLAQLTSEDGLRAIGAWALEGLRAVLEALDQGADPLPQPEATRSARVEYWHEMNPVEAWIDETGARGPGRTPIGEAYQAFVEWLTETHGIAARKSVISPKRFSQALARLGFGRGKAGSTRYVEGLRDPRRTTSATSGTQGRLPA